MKVTSEYSKSTAIIGLATSAAALIGLVLGLPVWFTLAISIFCLNAILRSVGSIVIAMDNKEVDWSVAIDLGIIAIASYMTIKYLYQFIQLVQIGSV